MKECYGTCKYNKRDFSKPQDKGYIEFCCGNENSDYYGVPNLTEIIREIHDGVAREMYCKGIDDFLKEICKMIVQSENNGNYRFYAVEIKQSIADLAEQLKAGVKNERY